MLVPIMECSGNRAGKTLKNNWFYSLFCKVHILFEILKKPLVFVCFLCVVVSVVRNRSKTIHFCVFFAYPIFVSKNQGEAFVHVFLIVFCKCKIGQKAFVL